MVSLKKRKRENVFFECLEEEEEEEEEFITSGNWCFSRWRTCSAVLPHFHFLVSRAGAPVGPKPAKTDPLASSVQLVFGRPNRRRPVPEASVQRARRTNARGQVLPAPPRQPSNRGAAVGAARRPVRRDQTPETYFPTNRAREGVLTCKVNCRRTRPEKRLCQLHPLFLPKFADPPDPGPARKKFCKKNG